MSLIKDIQNKAKCLKKHIVLAEGTEKRTVAAAAIITKEKIATITLLGNVEQIRSVAAQVDADLSGVNLIDPSNSDKLQQYAQMYHKMREAKGMTAEKALETMHDVLYYGVMMVHNGEAAGMVAGAQNSTGNVLRPALQIIKTKPGISSVSGAFLMISPNTSLGDNGVSVFADCAVNPTVTAEQMAEIAYCSAQTASDIAGITEPKVAMLSFSTKGSAEHELVTKVQEAVAIAHERYPSLQVDGELQLDAAIVPSVGELKAPGSPVAGRANVLVFPDLQSGNITYKAVQRFGGVEAIGPVLQGMAKPINDLSRGCSIEDIVNTVAMVCCQN